MHNIDFDEIYEAFLYAQENIKHIWTVLEYGNLALCHLISDGTQRKLLGFFFYIYIYFLSKQINNIWQKTLTNGLELNFIENVAHLRDCYSTCDQQCKAFIKNPM